MTAAVPLAPNLWRVPTVRWDLINSFLIRADDGSVTLVDTGLKKRPARILAALTEIGAGPADVTTIVLTHAHSDHAGGRRRTRERTVHGITVHDEDAAYVRAGTAPPRDSLASPGPVADPDARRRSRPGPSRSDDDRRRAARGQRPAGASHARAHPRALFAAA